MPGFVFEPGADIEKDYVPSSEPLAKFGVYCVYVVSVPEVLRTATRVTSSVNGPAVLSLSMKPNAITAVGSTSRRLAPDSIPVRV